MIRNNPRIGAKHIHQGKGQFADNDQEKEGAPLGLRRIAGSPATPARANATSWARSAAVAIAVSAVAIAVIVRLHGNVGGYHDRYDALTVRDAAIVELRSAGWQAVVAALDARNGGDAGAARERLDAYHARIAEATQTEAPGPRDLQDDWRVYLDGQEAIAVALESGVPDEARAMLLGTEDASVSIRNALAVQQLMAAEDERRFQNLSMWGTIAAIVGTAGCVGFLSWRTERNRRTIADATAQKLRTLAFVDTLTGLPNRAEFLARLDGALAQGREDRSALAVLFIDVDNFKSVNDTLGHAAGDELITQVAQRIRSAVRPTDMCARLGGDEFAIIVDRMADLEHSVLVTERVLAAMDEPFSVEGRQLSVQCSIGVAVSERGNDEADALMRNADVAMYVAKSRGKARFEVYEPSMHPDLIEQRELLDDLSGALEREELALYYQPIVQMTDGLVVGAEALLRWHHPSRRLVPPSKFIPIAEESGLIISIGRWVLEEACRQAAVWRMRFPGLATFGIAVNVSARQLADESFLADLTAAVRGFNIEPESLTLELTESMMLHDDGQTAQRIAAIRETGARIAIDDFGTGYSSLSYLQQFPVDVIKIDRSFTERMSADGRNFEVTRSIVELGRSLKLEIVAEGVEHAGQVAAFRSLGCTHAQGYYFGRPVPADEFTRIISRSIFSPSLRRAA